MKQESKQKRNISTSIMGNDVESTQNTATYWMKIRFKKEL